MGKLLERKIAPRDELSDLVVEAIEHTLAFNPLIGIRGQDVALAALALARAMALPPKDMGMMAGEYLSELRVVADGTSEAMPDPKDRRFTDPAWKSNFLFRRLLQLHGATQKSLAKVIDRSSLDALPKARAHFFLSLAADALAPSNWPLLNPLALRKLIDTGGENYVAGVRNLIHDIRNNNFLPSQVDKAPFQIGGQPPVGFYPVGAETGLTK